VGKGKKRGKKHPVEHLSEQSNVSAGGCSTITQGVISQTKKEEGEKKRGGTRNAAGKEGGVMGTPAGGEVRNLRSPGQSMVEVNPGAIIAKVSESGGREEGDVSYSLWIAHDLGIIGSP